MGHNCQAQPKPFSRSQAGGWDSLIISVIVDHPPRIVVFGSFRASASSQLVCSLFMISLDLAWLLLELFMTCLQIVHNLFVICSWKVYQLVHDLFMTCSWLVNDLLTTCSRLFHDLFMTFLWLVYNLFTTCSWLIHDMFINLFMTCLWLVYLGY